MKYHTKSEKFFTKEERERIKETTRKVESRTIGEVVVMVVDHSDRYPEAEVMGGVVLGSFLSLILTLVFFEGSLWTYIPLSVLFFFPSRLLFRRVPRLGAALIGVRRKHHAVRERAVRAFYEKGLYCTTQNTGVLFFLSLLERKVWVIADKGIHEKIGQETLNKFARAVSKGIRDGRACDALCEAIGEAGELLALHFPASPGHADQLPDDVITN